jgi:hypothetical protein
MMSKHNAADKVRPIIKAMERSIEAARSTRTQPPKPVPAAINHASVPAVAANAGPASPSRLKARPKRAWM